MQIGTLSDNVGCTVKGEGKVYFKMDDATVLEYTSIADTDCGQVVGFNIIVTDDIDKFRNKKVVLIRIEGSKKRYDADCKKPELFRKAVECLASK